MVDGGRCLRHARLLCASMCGSLTWSVRQPIAGLLGDKIGRCYPWRET